jgi:hypothetical protein
MAEMATSLGAMRVWRLAFGVWRLAFGVWRLAFHVIEFCWFGTKLVASLIG